MKIGIFYKQFLGKGGFPREWRRFALELAELGEQIVVYCYQGVEKIQPHPNIRVYTFHGSSNPSFRIPDELTRRLEQDQPLLDVVEIVGSFQPENITVLRFLRRVKIPYIIATIGQIAPHCLRRGWVRKIAFLYCLLRPALRRALAIHSFSKLESQWVQRWVDSPVIEAAHGSFREEVPLELDHQYLLKTFPFIGDRKILLYLGRLDIDGKGLDDLLEGFSLASVLHTDLVLLLIGPEDDLLQPFSKGNRKKLEQQIQKLGLHGRAYILPPIYGKEKYDALANADIFVYPSRFDILPRAVREALTLGCPVIVSTETHFGDLVEQYDAGTVCEVNSKSIARAISYMISNSDRLAAMRNNAKRLALTSLDWKTEALKLRDGISRALP